MTTSEENLSPQDSLRLIEEVIKKTRDNIRELSFCYLLWGWLIAMASIFYFLLHRYVHTSLYFLPFPIAAVIGIAATVMYSRKKLGSSETYLNYYLNRMWIVLGVGFITVIFINLVYRHEPFTYTLVIAAMGTLVSGWVIRFRPLVIGGGILLGAALVSIYIPHKTVVLLHGLAMISGFLIPGYMLRYSKSK